MSRCACGDELLPLLLGGGFLLGFLALLAAELAQVFDRFGHLRVVETGDFKEAWLLPSGVCRKEVCVAVGNKVQTFFSLWIGRDNDHNNLCPPWEAANEWS